ncbi:Retrovirus-related Pol polyprotein from type-1 retrotransposable element [Trichinella nativa]|uniref:Retrovirus-related Pol polyprotein from type-1 retrotransposable element n=1 Tax=Trichinella nativa TaxID=6335 RepID=A0A0V1KM57_9BILA|nr:Retrovirus-related Pol polyprotein from type-1 retrotransposable element [Trichinella nativa]KRZ48392.1 Retrovirus-related Pol polyprotein from type-1 retrotransposable element [Trichinella nativa]
MKIYRLMVLLPAVLGKKECGSSKSRATRVGVETIGIGLLFECGTFETHFENRGRIMPSRNNISNALSPQLMDREQGKDLRTRLEEGLTSSNIEMEGLINFLINEVLNIKDKERDTYVDGVVNVFTEFLRKPNDHQPRPPPKKRTKEEEKKSRRFEAGTHSSNRSSSETPNILRPTLSRTSAFLPNRCRRVPSTTAIVSAPLASPHPQLRKYSVPYFGRRGYAAPQINVCKNVGRPRRSSGVTHSIMWPGAFNCFLLARYIPPQLKNCRTTLIPKTNNPRPDAEDYRPITIASCIYRQFSKIVTRQLENCISLHPRQKAFRSGTDGAFDNITTLTTIVCADLAKAFDTVNDSACLGLTLTHGH